MDGGGGWNNEPDTKPRSWQCYVSNLEIVPGRKITKHLGLVQGSTVRSKHIGHDIMAGLNVLGGELTGYTELLQESREEATQRMVAQAIPDGLS